MHRLSSWLLGVTLLLAFLLTDTAIVALPAMLITPAQLFACALAFLLISGGLLFTVWRLE